jgi:hypothetical protein
MPVEWTLIGALATMTRARLATAHRNQDGVTEIVAILLAVAAVITIAAVVFAVLKAKAQGAANRQQF